MPGYIRISRDVFEDPAFASVRFPRPWALIDLIQLARYKSGSEFYNGRYIALERGQLCKSVRWLAQRWRWDEKTVSSFLRDLEIGGIISYKFPHSKGGVTNIISISNYDCFGDDSVIDSHIESHIDSSTDSNTYNIEKKEIKEQKNKEIKEKEETKVPPQKKPSVPYEDVLKLWNGTMKKVPKIRSLTQERKNKIKLRVSEMGGWDEAKQTLALCFQKIEESDFCNGSTGRWMASFDWFFENDKNWLKVYEGNYDNRTAKTPLEDLQEKIAKADAYFDERYGYADTTPGGVPTGGWFDSPDEQ